MEIRKHWLNEYKGVLGGIAAALTIALAAFSLLKEHTYLGRVSKAAVYSPDEETGFVAKANSLLEKLVRQGNEQNAGVRPHSMEELQRRYPALRFALPYGENMDGGARAADIRLVGIVTDSIHDGKDLDFYYNSFFPTLLKKQRNNLGDRVFRIFFSSEDRGLVIDRIRMQPGMFKVALDKQPWRGDVLCAGSPLFPDSTHCFLVWGQTALPIRLKENGDLRRGMVVRVLPNNATRQLETGKRQEIDYYDLFLALEKGHTTLNLRLPEANDCGVFIDYIARDSVAIKAVGCRCKPFGEKGPLREAPPMQAHEQGPHYALNSQLRLLITDTGGSRLLCEATLTRDNPMRTLSTFVRTSDGWARRNAADTSTDRFTRQILNGQAASLSNAVWDKDIELTIDPLLSLGMEKELQKYTENNLRNRKGFYDDDQFEVSLTIMDMATGNVIAAPYYRTEDENMPSGMALSRKNPALVARYCGSTFKPLAALAAVLTDSSLLRLDTRGKYSLDVQGNGKYKGKATFYGHATTAWSSQGSAARFWDGCASMNDFISASDDVYPVALVAKALGYGREASPFSFSNDEVLLRENKLFTWAHAPFISTLTNLYDFPSPTDYCLHDSLQMEYYVWDNLSLDSTKRFGLDNISPDPTLLHYDRFNSSTATLSNELATWVLGQGSNVSSGLKMAECWTRMLTKRKVRASLAAYTHGNRTAACLADGYGNDTWNAFLEELRVAQEKGSLLSDMHEAVRKLNSEENIGDSLILFAKTGTPENYLREEFRTVRGKAYWVDMGLYCMGLMPESSYEAVRAGNPGNGLMCVMSIVRIVNHEEVAKNNSTIMSEDARLFFSGDVERLRKLYRMARPQLTTCFSGNQPNN